MYCSFHELLKVAKLLVYQNSHICRMKGTRQFDGDLNWHGHAGITIGLILRSHGGRVDVETGGQEVTGIQLTEAARIPDTRRDQSVSNSLHAISGYRSRKDLH